MAYLNCVQIIGNLVRDPEIKTSAKGTPFGRVTIGVTRKYTVGEEKKEEASFFDVDVNGSIAESLGKYKKKGDPILVVGRLQQQQWEDKTTGAKRSAVLIRADSVQFLARPEKDPASAPQRSASAPMRQAPPASKADAHDDGSDIPF